MPPLPPDGKVGIRVAKKFRFFRFTFNKFQPKDNSVQSLLHLLAMQLICNVPIGSSYTFTIVIADNISCPTHKFPLRKLNSRLTVLQFIVK